MRVAQENASIAQKALQLADKRVAAGKAPPLESNAARVELANARIDARAAEAALQVARRGLAVLWAKRRLRSPARATSASCRRAARWMS